jgi:hypothetical protein
MSYQQLQDHWPDDQQTESLPRIGQEPQSAYPGAYASASGGYGASPEPRAGRHRRSVAPLDGQAPGPGVAPGPSAASFPVPAEAQPDRYQPQGWPDQQPRQPSFTPYLPSYARAPYPPKGQPLPSQQQPNGAEPPSQTRSRWRPSKRKIWVALMGLSALIGIVVGIRVATTHNSPSAGNAAATSTASAATAQAVPVSTSPIDDWCSGSGYSDYQAVQSDLAQMSTDIGNGDYGTAENADATQLSRDADTAMQNPPPGTKSQKINYVLYMGAVAFSAADLNAGNITTAEKAMNGAADYRDKVDAIVAACG